MVDNKNKWWEKRTPRSVDYLKLWKENPRFDTAESQSRIKLADFAEDIISEPSDKASFFELIKSIIKLGFMDFEPIVVWKDDSDRYVVAEGNRRILALKLLRNPDKAPKSIRKFILQQSKLISRNDIEKVQVCVAPSLEATRWYVLQRHSTSSIQKPWQRLQQQRFIVSLYDEYNHDIDKIIAVTGFTRSEIIQALRYVQLRDLATRKQVTDLMTTEEKELIYSNRISMTILERWFASESVRERWGVKFDGMKVKITSNEDSFLHAYGKFLKLMFNVEPNDLNFVVNTRSIPEKNEEIFKVLPEVTFPSVQEEKILNPSSEVSQEKDSQLTVPLPDEHAQEEQESNSGGESPKDINPVNVKHKNDRRRMVVPQTTIKVHSAKLNSLFSELKRVPVHLYTLSASITLRVFLDLSVDDFIRRKGLEKSVATQYKKDYNHTILQQRLKFLCDEHVNDSQANKVISKLLQPKNEHSLDTLNSYMHGHETHKIDYRFVNGFWDMLTPLLKVLIELKER
ncbi:MULTISPECIES: ParB/Srx family N-terminal domain-containing protein [Vibrio]|uniref:ParB/Srx family N-terminal domain-containing protein n=1 Tax=Vibrio TaxID=662 RepID=UPI001869A277|nr:MULTISPECIES: ParB/Srx family N-terminal domain-containing protein [Vibrio]MBE4128697.1 ParB N-terminal domain-containing protein [Vibrio parahaemolyticus]MBN8112525.1 ParB N-terminal domain-containing protein [Vibrio vulnificus]MCZ5870107.1 ParB/Srx family N-terminal domain-containing protein [Vibrio parahaemolyticus]MCZ5900465.1 ParB/Srx family N-terminal domain-containing protein [Vibrio parahaemolyticus]MCZ6023373.1 ParB/Srx family N-terminal domain-containing protein [Vibrio parahaemol